MNPLITDKTLQLLTGLSFSPVRAAGGGFSSGNRGNLQTLLIRQIFLLFVLAAVTLPGTNIALAQTNDHTKPINVKADSSVYNERSGTQTLSGNVEITQGSMSIFADNIVIEIRNGALFRITGNGSPIRFEQLTPNNELIKGECNEIVYNTATTEITFRGNASFERPGQRLSGDTIEYNLNELTFKAAGNNQGRVNITLQPDKLNR